MEGFAKTAAIYFFLLVLFRVAGKRSLQEVTIFDFVLLLIISEATQQALVGADRSLTGAFVCVTTLVLLDIALSLLKQRSKWVERILDGTPLLLVERGKVLRERMEKERIDESEVLEAARSLRGLARMDEIEYAVLERNGAITIVPRR